MPATLKTLVESRIGTVTETTLLNDALSQAMANLLNALPKEKAYQYASEVEGVASTGVTVRGRVFSARVNDEVAKVVDAARAKAAQKATSIYSASAMFPVVWRDGTLWKGYPNGAPDEIWVNALLSPDVQAETEEITNMPEGAEELAVLYACLQILANRHLQLVIPTIGSFPTVPTAPAVQTLSYTNASAGTIGAVTIAALPALPAYGSVTPTLPADAVLGALTLPSLPDISLSLPLPTLAYTDVTASAIAATTLGALPVFSDYTKPTVTPPVAVTLGALTLPSAPDELEIPAPNVTHTDGTSPSVAGTTIGALPAPPTYTKPTVTAPTRPLSIGTLTLPTAPDPSTELVAPSFSYTDAVGGTVGAISIGVLPTPPVYTAPTELASILGVTDGALRTDADINDISKWFSVLGKQIEKEEDPELAAQMIARLNQYMQAVSLEVQNSVNEFNADVEEFRAETQRIIEQARIDLQAAIQQAQIDNDIDLQNELQTLQAAINEYQSDVARFNQLVALYQTEVQAEVEAWRANELEAKINYYLNEYNVLLNQYQMDIQNELNEFNAELADYTREVDRLFEQARVTLQEELQNAQIAGSQEQQNTQLALQAQIADLDAEAQRFSVLINNYQAQVNSAIQDWTLTEWQGKFIKWVQEYQTYLQEYQLDIQNESQRAQTAIVEYQTEAQKVFQQAETDLQEALAAAANQNDIAKQNALYDLQEQIEQWRISLERYQTQLQEYQLETDQAIQDWTLTEFQGKFVKWRDEYNSKLQKYQLDLSQAMQEFQAGLPEFQAGVEKVIQQANITLQQLQAQAQLDTGVAQQNANSELQAQIVQYQADLNRYSVQVQGFSTEVGTVVQAYSAALQSQQAEQNQLAQQIEHYTGLYNQKLQIMVLPDDPQEINRNRS